MTIKIFSIYHKESEIFESEVIEPIQTGCNFTDLDLGILKDNTGENIADKNPYYGEMTAWYWVWKNYLKKNPEVEYIGFCHYRRFLDFQKQENKKPFEDFISIKELFKDLDNKYSNDGIAPFIKNFDIILPKKEVLEKERGSMYQQYVASHPKIEIDKLINIIKEFYPNYVEDMDSFLNGNRGYFCLNFLIKKEYFLELMNWVFDLLQKMNEVSDWEQYNEYLNKRTPAYLIERFINVWINHKIRTKGIKVLERKSYMLCSKKIYLFPGVSIVKNEKHTIYNIFKLKFSIKNKRGST